MRYRLDHFFENLQIEVGRLRMTMKAFMDEIGVSYPRLNYWRAGQPTLLEVVCICEYLGCTLEDLCK